MALIFLDLETTGLNPSHDRILEIAAAAVDAQLNPVSGFGTLIQPNPGVSLGMDEYVTKMHAENGLLAELQNGAGVSLSDAIQGFCAWLNAQPRNEDGKHTLAGDSVHFDLGFLRAWLPTAVGFFSHRLLDVSAFRVARAYMGSPACPVVGGGHRAQSDVLASIAKARWHFSRIGP